MVRSPVSGIFKMTILLPDATQWDSTKAVRSRKRRDSATSGAAATKPKCYERAAVEVRLESTADHAEIAVALSVDLSRSPDRRPRLPPTAQDRVRRPCARVHAHPRRELVLRALGLDRACVPVVGVAGRAVVAPVKEAVVTCRPEPAARQSRCRRAHHGVESVVAGAGQRVLRYADDIFVGSALELEIARIPVRNPLRATLVAPRVHAQYCT